jgi:hypothetical protein
MSTLDAHQSAEDAICVRLQNVVGGDSKAHPSGVPSHLLQNTVDQLQGAEGAAPAPLLRFSPDRKELRRETACAR